MTKSNTLKYTIALFVCFFVLVLGVDAATYSMDLPINNNFSIGTPSYSNMTCSERGTSFTTITNNGSGVSIVKYVNETTNGTQIVVNCTWTENGVGATRNGNATYNFRLNNDPTATSSTDVIINNVSITIGTIAGYRDGSGNPVSSNVMNYLGSATFSASDVTMVRGGEYISFVGGSCSSSSCVVYPSAQMESLGGHNRKTAEFKIRVTFHGEQFDITVKVTIDMSGGTRVFPGNYTGVDCGLPNGVWESPASGNYYVTDQVNAALPNCTVTSTEYEFKGWNKTNDGAINNAEIDRCYNTVDAGTAAQIGSNYTICLKSKPQVTIAFGRGSLVSDGTNWVEAGSSYAYKYSDSSTVTLPSIDAEGFAGWRKGGYSGELVPAGTTVAVDGTRYFAEIQSTRVYTDQRKTVRVGKQMSLTFPNLESCTVDSGVTNLTVSYNATAHECIVSGVEATEEGVTIPVVLTFSSGSRTTATYTFKVVDSSGSTGSDSAFIDITDEYTVVWGENYYGDATSGVAPTVCTQLMIGWGDKNRVESTFFGGSWSDGSRNYSKGSGGGGTVQSSYYTVDASACDSGNTYWSFCLDPGLHGPDSGMNPYKVQDGDLESSDRLKKLMVYLIEHGASESGDGSVTIESIVNQAENKYRIAVHHTTRLAAMMDGIDSGHDAFPGRYHWYINTANAIKGLGDTPSETDVYNKIKENFSNGDYPINSSNADRNFIAKLMAHYIAASATQDVSSGQIERVIEDTEINIDGSINNEVTGKLLLPASASNPHLEGFSYKGITGTVTQQPTEAGTDDDGRLIFEFKVKLSKPLTSTEKLPATDEEKNKASFTLTFDGSGLEKMFLATSVDHGNSWQRMLVFNVGNAKMKIYIPLQISCGKLMDAGVSEEIMVANQCCSYYSDAEIESSTYLSLHCAKKCTENSFAQVCSYAATPGMVDVYKVQEAKLNGENQIGQCVVNVTDEYSVADEDNFTRYDQNNNKYNVEAFEGSKNKWCDVTCKEDWTIVMEAYGNYVGLNAIAAGSYFRIKTNDTFMGGKTECYTTYLDYVKFTEEQSDLSENVVVNYDKYSYISHVYTDIDKQTVGDTLTVETTVLCVKNKSCADSYPGVEGGSSWDGSQCYHMESCTCDPEDTDCECPKKVVDGAPLCKTEGSYHSYKIKTKGDVDSGGTDRVYSTFESHSTDNHDGVSTENRELQDNNVKMKDEYKGEYAIKCKGTEPTEPEALATIECPESGFDNVYSYSGETNNSEWCNSIESDNTAFCVKADGDGKKSDVFEYLKETFTGKLDTNANTHRNLVSSYTGEIYTNAEKFYYCQHIQIKNISTLPSNAQNNPSYKVDYYVLGLTKNYGEITTKFQPGASYKYDDDAYMSLLKDDNIVDQYLDRNNFVLEGQPEDFNPESSSKYSDETNFRVEYEIQSVNSPSGSGDSTEKVYVAKNYLESAFYWSADPWENDSQESKDYDSSSKKTFNEDNPGPQGNGDTSGDTPKKATITLCNITGSVTFEQSFYTCHKCANEVQAEVHAVQTDDTHWKNGSCFEVPLKYRDVNYVKTSIENGSFYKNKGNWYFSESNSLFAAHGDSLEDAYNNLVSIASSGGGGSAEIPSSPSSWKTLGIMNVFPVSYSAPRNLYTYTYYFGDIGYYFDSGDLGRIMGGQTPIIENNSRTCFYEIYEEVCRCCASDQYTYGIGSEEVERLLGEVQPTVPTYNFSSESEIAANTKSYLGIVPSHVQLADLNGDLPNDEALAISNWGINEFYYDGTNYQLDKGEQLRKYIEAKGETIYSQDVQNEYNLEYSFTLTPSVLSEIHDYNTENGYDIAADRVTPYGRYLNGGELSEVTTELDSDDADTISFIHYGSVFLESHLSRSAINRSLADRGDSVCYVQSGFFGGSLDSGNEIKEKMSVDGCRWVDFVAPAQRDDRYNTTSNADASEVTPISYIRTAFK